MVQILYIRLLLITLCSLSECIQRRYHYIKTEKTWSDAQTYCKTMYTDLTTVNNMKDMKKLMKSVNNNQRVWIGLKNTGVYKWKWSLGDAVNYQNWESDLKGQNNCAFMKNGKWHHQSCGQKSKFICYNETSKSYFNQTSEKTWRKAQSFCRQFHTDLASVRDLTENQQIEKIINSAQISVWIGLFSDSWEWSDKSDSGFRNWTSGEPNGGRSPCCAEVRMNVNGEWNDAACSASQTFVCHEDKLILIKKKLTWIDALKYCREKHVDLVSVASEEIQLLVTDVVKQASTAEVWLGLRHSCALDVWYWVIGEIVCYENWTPGNETAPVNCQSKARSGAVQSGGDHRWISLPETEKRNFICSRYD